MLMLPYHINIAIQHLGTLDSMVGRLRQDVPRGTTILN